MAISDFEEYMHMFDLIMLECSSPSPQILYSIDEIVYHL